MADYKKYTFKNDYTTKYGVIKKGTTLSAYYSKAGKNPSFMFDFYEVTDPAKAEAGEGVFNILESDMKNVVDEVGLKSADTNTTTDATKKVEEDKTPKTGFRSWSATKKTIVIGSGLAVLGLAVWYFVIRKK